MRVASLPAFMRPAGTTTMTREFAAFVIAGGVAAGVNWLSNVLLLFIMPLEVSVMVAYLVGMTTAYILNRLFVFELSGRSVHEEYVRFVIVNVIALVQVWLVTVGLARFIMPAIGWTFHPAEVAHAIGVASPIVTSYLGHRYFTFSRKLPHPPR